MKTQRLALVLTAVNLALLLVSMTPARPPAAAQDASPVLRARRLELVDERGQIRSSLKVEADGEVVFRLLDQNGTIRVKLGANDGGSGLLLADETTEPGVHMIARRVGTAARPNTTGVTLTGADEQQYVIRP